MAILIVLLFILFVIAIPISLGYLVDPDETSKVLRDFFYKFHKYDIQEQMSFFQESMWVEKVINSCTTHQQLWNADKLIPLLCTKYKGKVKENAIKNIRYRLRDIRDKKHWHVD